MSKISIGISTYCLRRLTYANIGVVNDEILTKRRVTAILRSFRSEIEWKMQSGSVSRLSSQKNLKGLASKCRLGYTDKSEYWALNSFFDSSIYSLNSTVIKIQPLSSVFHSRRSDILLCLLGKHLIYFILSHERFLLEVGLLNFYISESS